MDDLLRDVSLAQLVLKVYLFCILANKKSCMTMLFSELAWLAVEVLTGLVDPLHRSCSNKALTLIRTEIIQSQEYVERHDSSSRLYSESDIL